MTATTSQTTSGGQLTQDFGTSKTDIANARAAMKANLELAQQQLAAIDQQMQFQQGQITDLPGLLGEQKAAGTAAGDVSAGIAPQQADLLRQFMTLLSNGQGVTPEQAALIDEATNAAFGVGASQITSSATDAARSIGQQLTPNLGLRGTDTPIQDRGALLSMATATQLGQLAQGLSGANAQARLAYPLQANAQQASQLGDQQQFLEAVRQFQSSLQQQAFANRLNLTGQTGQLGLGLVGGTSGGGTAASNVAGTTATVGLGLTPRTTTGSTNDPWGTAIGLVGAAGGGATGFADVTAAFE